MKYCKILLFLLLMIVNESNAQEITCEDEQLINVKILIGHPGIVSPYKPGHILVFQCTDVNLKMYGQRTIECLSNGKWDHPYPRCGEELCPLKTTEEDLKIVRFPNIEGPIKPGHYITVSCTGQWLTLNGPSTVICQSNGEWSSPFPKCEEQKCVANLPENMRSDATEDEKAGSEISVKPGRTITLSCARTGSKLQGEEKITCLFNGEWNIKFPKCTGEKCGPPPIVDNADTLQIAEQEYNIRERVTYKCFEKYKLDDRPSYSDSLICQDGEWRGNVYCLKPCTVTMEEMDKRGLIPRWGNLRKVFCEHKDFLSFACQRGTMRGNPRQMCSDGVMTFPECV